MVVSAYQQYINFLRGQMVLHPEWMETYKQQIKVLQLNLTPEAGCMPWRVITVAKKQAVR